MKPMGMRLITALLLLLLGAGSGYWWARRTPAVPATPAAAPESRKVLYWYDPMVPTQKFDKPGKSPFMDMDLVPRYADQDNSATPGVSMSNRASQNLGLRRVTVTRRSMASTLDLVGVIQLSDREISLLQARANGFVERVYGRAVGDVVSAGSPLADVQYPDWSAAQYEYLAVRAIGDATLRDAARQRLTLLGMPPTLVQQIEQSGRAQPLITVHAPHSGVITELMVRPGMTLSAGASLARINGLSTVWLELALPEAQAAMVSVGQPVQARFPALPDATVNGKVAAILAETNRDSRTLRVRVELPNPHQQLRAGLSAQVRLQGPTQDLLVVPAEAVIRTGKRALVYLAEDGGTFRPVEVGLGVERESWLAIRHGLSEGQNVVASAQFLLDSEASVRGIAPAAVSTSGNGH